MGNLMILSAVINILLIHIVFILILLFLYNTYWKANVLLCHVSK